MDQRARKLKNRRKALQLRDDVDRRYVEKKKGEGLTSIEDNIDASIQQLEDYIEKREGRLFTPTKNNTDNTSIKRKEGTRKQNGKKNDSMDV